MAAQHTTYTKPSAAASIGLGGVTCIIVVNVVHPIDTIKCRLQTQSNFSIPAFLRTEGVSGLYKGIQPAWFREGLYSSVKIGGYAPIRDIIQEKMGEGFGSKFLAGSLSGSLGSIIGNPFDVLKTKIQANPGDSSMVTLAKDLWRDQGVSGFTRGVTASMTRAAVLTGTKMACYDRIKGLISEESGWSRKDLRTQFGAAVGAGFFMTCTCTPFDYLRTTLMNQPTDAKLYSGMFDCAVKTVKSDGPFALYRGFFAIWARFAPAATLQLIIFEQLLHLNGYEAI